ncbi:uncharacterized protein LOC122061767 isoform X2 [Macadamia integrifolia]|uniref:uncharacterized protein LOC122061767 isoform X2 n=1 Tax=Macadamia integrifolia TaxID=60698 RepID=UPI001C5277EB|nr:uncharacterized protein LOC122061767 isoform X2 [Macadamia integrifolia]
MSDELFGKEADAKTIYLKASQRQAQLWYKKAKQKWMKDGDRNFKYFHLSVKIRRAHNQIRSLQKEDGSWIFDQQALKSYISSYYESFHGAAQLTPHWKLLDNIPQVLGDGENDILLAVPSKDEITKAVWDLDPDSSPGPDGFSGVFARFDERIISNSPSSVKNAVPSSVAFEHFWPPISSSARR